MYLSEQSKATVRPRDFWLAVLAVTLLLCGMGFLPTASPTMVTVYHGIEAAFLLFVWTLFLIRMTGKSRRDYTAMNFVAMAGCTLIFGSDLIPHQGHTADWAKNIGTLLIFLTILPTFITFGKRPPTVPRENTPPSPNP